MQAGENARGETRERSSLGTSHCHLHCKPLLPASHSFKKIKNSATFHTKIEFPARAQLILPITESRFTLPNFFFFLNLSPHREACRILVPQPGVKPTPPAVEAWSLNHWTTREVPYSLQFKIPTPQSLLTVAHGVTNG